MFTSKDRVQVASLTTTALDLDWVQPSQDGGVILLRAIRGGVVGGFYWDIAHGKRIALHYGEGRGSTPRIPSKPNRAKEDQIVAQMDRATRESLPAKVVSSSLTNLTKH